MCIRDSVDLTREGELVNTGDKGLYTITPYVTTGNKIDIAAVAVPNTVKPVSYTHLDVYKRQ